MEMKRIAYGKYTHNGIEVTDVPFEILEHEGRTMSQITGENMKQIELVTQIAKNKGEETTPFSRAKKKAVIGV